MPAFDTPARQREIPDPRLLGSTERVASATVGALLLLLTRPSHPLRSLATAAVGSYLVYRGASGRCPLVGRVTECCSVSANVPSPHMQSSDAPGPRNVLGFVDQTSYTPDDSVDEAEMESFPASDPPSYSGGTASPSEHL